ncbi:hypothetical protein V6C42_13050 [Pseudoclostridium thermosuccinogenes]|uniref:hypothetical protein n=1 Tax=Clostridium thermosuccinogenes TaxID=84032 RepID=UPI002FD87F1B
MTIENAKQIINEYISDPFNFVAPDFLKTDTNKGIKVINWRKGRYGWSNTSSYYTAEQVEKLKENRDPFANNEKLYDYMFEIDGIYHIFHLK